MILLHLKNRINCYVSKKNVGFYNILKNWWKKNSGRVDDFTFFDCSSPFCFFVNWISLYFLIFYKILPYYVYYYCILIRIWKAVGTSFFFMSALLLSILTPLFLPSSSVSLPYFVLAVPMRECLEKHSCMSSPCPIAILNGTFLFREAK